MNKKTKLNLGCGTDIKKNYVNLDFIKMKGVDVIHDLNKFLYPFNDDTFSEIYCRQVLESVDDIVKTMEELHRICKNGAVIKIFEIYYNCYGICNEPHLKRGFTDQSFDWVEKRHKTGFYTKKDFKITKKELIPTRFGRLFPKCIRKTMGMILGEVFSNVYFEIKVIKK